MVVDPSRPEIAAMKQAISDAVTAAGEKQHILKQKLRYVSSEIYLIGINAVRGPFDNGQVRSAIIAELNRATRDVIMEEEPRSALIYQWVEAITICRDALNPGDPGTMQ